MAAVKQLLRPWTAAVNDQQLYSNSIINRDVELMCSSILKTIHKKRFVS
uniref:Uncharacterized protein n=1 Tax=Anguilla anguilla TaxID=7936 RepID=A0A0E9TTK5_ANGAN